MSPKTTLKLNTETPILGQVFLEIPDFENVSLFFKVDVSGNSFMNFNLGIVAYIRTGYHCYYRLK